jgi:hypothetical protein
MGNSTRILIPQVARLYLAPDGPTATPPGGMFPPSGHPAAGRGRRPRRGAP